MTTPRAYSASELKADRLRQLSTQELLNLSRAIRGAAQAMERR